MFEGALVDVAGYLEFCAKLRRNVDFHAFSRDYGPRTSIEGICTPDMKDVRLLRMGVGGCADYPGAQLVGLDG
jgi:hypothetical protein